MEFARSRGIDSNSTDLKAFATGLGVVLETISQAVSVQLAPIYDVLEFLKDPKPSAEAAKSVWPDHGHWQTYYVRRLNLEQLGIIEEDIARQRHQISNLISGKTFQEPNTQHSSVPYRLGSVMRHRMPEAWDHLASSALCLPMVASEQERFMEDAMSMLKPAIFAPGAFLIKQNTLADSMFFLSSGKCMIIMDGQHVGERASGDTVGEIALVCASARTADIVASTPVEAFQLCRRDFETLTKKHAFVRR